MLIGSWSLNSCLTPHFKRSTWLKSSIWSILNYGLHAHGLRSSTVTFCSAYASEKALKLSCPADSDGAYVMQHPDRRHQWHHLGHVFNETILEEASINDPTSSRHRNRTTRDRSGDISVTQHSWASWPFFGAIKKWCMAIWERVTKKNLDDLKLDLQNIRWFREPVIPPDGPWRSVYGFRPVPKRYCCQLFVHSPLIQSIS